MRGLIKEWAWAVVIAGIVCAATYVVTKPAAQPVAASAGHK
jgi:hypothetical protein